MIEKSMHEEILVFLKDYLEAKVNVAANQVDYYGNMAMVDHRVPLIALEPLEEAPKAAQSTRWEKAPFTIRLWILTAYSMDYLEAFSTTQRLLTAHSEDQQIYGVHGAIKEMNKDDDFLAKSGNMAGTEWRIAPEGVKLGRIRYGVTQRADLKLNTATQEIQIFIETER